MNIQPHLIQKQPVPISDSFSLRGSEKNADKRWAGITRNIRAFFCSAGNVIQAKTVWSAGILLQGKPIQSAGILPFRKHPSHPIFGRFVTRPKMGCLGKIERNFCDLFLPSTKSHIQAPILFKQNPQVSLPTWNQAEVLFKQPAKLSGKNHLQAAHSNQDQTPALRAEPGQSGLQPFTEITAVFWINAHSRRLA
ncbi:MAG TPA: hypothetical protein PK693_12460 [Halothiobacillus sp.]|nr:hypothetical protein [Halothiobacillus sp.]